jgi:SAM-dependent methyltransferase
MSEIREQVRLYYTDRFREHGPVARGVDWNSEQSQELRFEQFLRLLPVGVRFSIVDYGCGYGALYEFLRGRGLEVSYVGFDLSSEMIEYAAAAYPDAEWTTSPRDLRSCDVAVASGVFNVKQGVPAEEWQRYAEATIDELARVGSRGFAFNMLTSYSEPEKMRPDLYYGDPTHYFELCRARYGRHVALLHDYGLWEFTIGVRRG